MRLNTFGFWREFGWYLNNQSILLGIPEYKERCFDVEDDFIEYLESGVPLTGLRLGVKCPFTGENLKSPSSYTDGKYVWTNAYIHYLSKGVISLDEDLAKHIKERNFTPVNREEIPLEILNYLDEHIY
jgi:hypothetical protein